MHPDLKSVIELQQVDTRLAELAAQIDALPAEVQAIEAKLNEFIQAHEDRKKRLAASQKERKDLEGDIQDIKGRISKHRDQLYQVKTNEQYRAMLREIEGEEQKITSVEDKVLEKMIEAEDIQKRIVEASARLDSEQARVAAEIQSKQKLRDVDIEERERSRSRRKELIESVPAEVNDLYERIRKARQGVAIAEVREGFCSACHVSLRPQRFNEVIGNDTLMTCENCGRIIYYVPPATDELAAGDEGAEARA